MIAIPTTEPSDLIAGDTATWKRSLNDFPAGDGWVLTYELRGPGKITITATADGNDHLVDEKPTATSLWGPGRYSWAAFVTKAPDRYRIRRGSFDIKPDLAKSATLDARSHGRKVLEAIEAVLETRATKDQSAYSIDGRTLSRTPIADLLVLRDRYAALVASEEQSEALTRGVGTRSRILVRF